jgi:putative ABC transport system permease protein
LLKIAARNLWRRKSRSLLAVLALVIGVLAIVLLVSLTGGLRASFTDLIGSVNGIWVMQKGVADQTLSKIDLEYAEKIEEIPGVQVVLPEVWVIVSQIDGERAVGSVMMGGSVAALGLDPVKEQLRKGMPYGVSILRGRMFKPGDSDVAIVGKQISDDYRKTVGSTIKINDEKFKVIGVFAKSDFTDSVIAVTLKDAQGLAGLDSNTVQDFVVQLTHPENEDRVARNIEFKWPDDLEAWTMSETSDMLGEMLGVIDQFFWIIAAIGLLIAAVGIINTMLISIKERMKEFGVLRSMGWTQEDVLKLIVIESVLLGLGGGLIGVALGYLITGALSGYLPFPLVVAPELSATAFVFSALSGLVGGVYPAWKASKMDPIKAIRGEA